MLLLIPTQISENLSQIDNVILQVSGIDIALKAETIKFGSVELNDSLFDSVEEIKYKVILKDSSIKNFYFHDKSLAIHPKVIAKQMKENSTTLTTFFGSVPPHLLRVNFDSPLSNTEENK